MSEEVTEPNSCSLSPALRAKLKETPCSESASVCAAPFSVASFEALHVARGSFDAELTRQKKITSVTGSYFDELAAISQLFHIFLQDNLHRVHL
jgi:hypothetical protein